MALKKKKKAKKAVKKLVRKKIRKPVKKTVKRKSTPKKKSALRRKPALKKPVKPEGKLIGAVTHYFPHVQAAVIKLKAPLSMGEVIKVKGHTTDLSQAVISMQIDRVDISNAKKGDEIGLQVSSRVRQGDKVYKL
ncbi:MAG: hypothetical protein PHI07_06570 [Candidatus Omnitrophica bacterium]|jgi:putative protease|nr:hypothetical protein [Candidatus Omnitrophota bacterium]